MPEARLLDCFAGRGLHPLAVPASTPLSGPIGAQGQKGWCERGRSQGGQRKGLPGPYTIPSSLEDPPADPRLFYSGSHRAEVWDEGAVVA